MWSGLTEFLTGFNCGGGAVVGNQILEVLLSRPCGHCDKLFRPVGGILCVDDFGDQKIGKILGSGKSGVLRQRRAKNRHVPWPSDWYFVVGVVWARTERLHYDEDVLELRADVLWCERKSARLLEDNGDNVVADVSFSQQLENKNGTCNCWAIYLQSYKPVVCYSEWKEAKSKHETWLHNLDTGSTLSTSQ